MGITDEKCGVSHVRSIMERRTQLKRDSANKNEQIHQKYFLFSNNSLFKPKENQCQIRTH